MSDEWREFWIQGWGPDYSDTIVTCPRLGCSWECRWEDRTTLGVVTDAVQRHTKEAHRGR